MLEVVVAQDFHMQDPPIQPVLDDDVLGKLMNSDMHFRLQFDLVAHFAIQDPPYLFELDDE
ncbi:hypothetical protein Hanom_Chr05g00441391 [Helianthus anomalus]